MDESLSLSANGDVVIYHQEYYLGYRRISDKTFTDVCKEMGLDDADDVVISI